MIYNKFKSLNNNGKKQKIIRIHEAISPIYKNYFNNISKNNNINKNYSSYINNTFNEKEKQDKNIQNLTPNSNSKDSSRNLFYQYNHNYNSKNKNTNINQQTKYKTNINSPRQSLFKNVNFRAKKMNLNIKTLNMKLAINKYKSNIPTENEDFNSKRLYKKNMSVVHTTKNSSINDKSIIFQNNKIKNDMTKIQVNNLRNQLDQILSTKNRSNSGTKRNINIFKNKEIKELENNSIFSYENSFAYNNYTLTENNQNKNKCILLKNKKINKSIYKNKKERKKRNELNIKLFNSLKNNFIGMKLPTNKKKIKNENHENISKIKFRNKNRRNKELRTSKTQIETIENESSSIIKVPKINKSKRESSSIDNELNKNKNKSSILNKLYTQQSSNINRKEKNFSKENYSMIIDSNNIINQKEIINKKCDEMENKYEILLQSYKTLKSQNINLIQENKSLKQEKKYISEENSFLNNYIISTKKIFATIITTYSKQIKNLTKIVKNYISNSKSEYQDKINKIKNVINKYSLQDLEKNKKVNSIIQQLIQENKILRKILIIQKPDKNYYSQEKQGFIEQEYKLNFNYDFLKNLNKIDKDFEKKLYLNISFNNNVNKNNSVKKKMKKEKKYIENENLYINENKSEENNKMIEKKKIKYTKNKK